MGYYDKRFVSDGKHPKTEGSKRMEKFTDGFPGEDRSRPWTDEELLRRLYHDELLSQNQISKGWDCSQTTVSKWLDKHGIEARDRSESAQNFRGTLNQASFYTHPRGYERWRTGKDTIEHHRLLAVVEYGVDEVAEKEVHHENNIPWDNRLENIELVKSEDHAAEHRKVTGIDRLRVAELYEHGDISSRDLAEMFNVSSATILHIHQEGYS